MAGELVDISVVRRNLAFRIRQFHELEKPGVPDDAYCDQLCRLSVHKRQLGICLLLEDLDWAGFRKSLAESAAARVELLEWTGDAQATFRQFTCIGRSGPLFDAIAASRLDLARRIGELSRAPYTEDYEYADDRAFARFVQALIAAELRPEPEHRRLLAEFVEASEGKGGARQAIAEALLEGDERALSQGLRDLSDEHGAAYREEADGTIFDHFRFRTERFVDVEGIALRALATFAGLRVDGAIPFLPDERD